MQRAPFRVERSGTEAAWKHRARAYSSLCMHKHRCRACKDLLKTTHACAGDNKWCQLSVAHQPTVSWIASTASSSRLAAAAVLPVQTFHSSDEPPPYRHCLVQASLAAARGWSAPHDEPHVRRIMEMMELELFFGDCWHLIAVGD